MGLRHTNRRLRTSVGFVLFSLVLLLSRAVYIQVVQGAEYSQAADRQYLREVEMPALRGLIYDREGAQLAVSEKAAMVVANPHQVEGAQETAKQLSPVLGMPEQDILPALQADKGFSYVARKVERSVAERALSLKLPGIQVRPEDKRVYPKGTLAPQLLGYVGNENKGLAGLELEYNEVLAGDSGERKYIGDRTGRSLDILIDQGGREGHSLTLTLDEDIQWQAEQVLLETVQKYGAKRATAVVLDPTTGEVLAMANAPLFDANRYSETDPALWRNMAVTDQYEPGSTFKLVTVAAALERGLVTPETKLRLQRTIKVWDKEVGEAHSDGLPLIRNLSVTQILAQSSNVGTITLGKMVKKEGLLDMARRFGFGEKTGIDFPGEVRGDIPPADKWSGTTIANLPIGQGVAVTPLQLAVAYAAIANDGVLMQPYLVENKHVKTPSHRVVSSEVAAQLRQMLTDTVSDGTGHAAKVPGYVVAGKTGTAEKPKEHGRGYDTDRVVASFVGMVPASDPRLVILVCIDEPTLQHLGGAVAAPAFAKIADFALKHLEIPPERPAK